MRPKAIERIKIGRARGRELTQQPTFDGGVDGRPGRAREPLLEHLPISELFVGRCQLRAGVAKHHHELGACASE
jgi:hypothetical protein